MDLLSVIVKPTWKEMIIDLVASRQMDPWDIDITAVADAYLQKVRELQALDLRVPANVILACALLLRFKADSISFDEPAEEEYYEEPQLIQEDVPDLVLRPSRPRPRRLTLQELIAAVENVMKEGDKPVVKIPAPKELKLEMPRVDMSEFMTAVYSKALSMRDTEGIVAFSQLVKKTNGLNGNGGGKTANTPSGEGNGGNGHALEGNGNAAHAPAGEGNGGSGKGSAGGLETAMKFLNSYETPAEGVVYHLIPVLHLVQERRMLAWQDETFGEIFLRVLEPGEQVPAAAQADAQAPPAA